MKPITSKALFWVLVILVQNIFSQTKEFSYLSIPAQLKENANAVIRLNNTVIDVQAIDQLSIKEKRVVTVLNKLGNGEVQAYMHYDNDSKISRISAVVYDAMGSKIKKYSKSKFLDASAVDGGTLYSDSRVLYLDYTPTSYPYTIEFETEYKTSSTGFIKGWFPIEGYHISVEKSRYVLNNNSQLKFKKKESNFNGFDIENKSSENQLSYVVENQKAQVFEYNAVSSRDFLPLLKVSLDEFSLKGVKGRGANWEEFGKWMYDYLLKDRDLIAPKTVAIIKKMVDGVEDPIERAKIVYKYMQNKTRYISVQVGIGGWEPIPANEVDKVGYGDCKGLTNYTKALLDLVGVKSYYTVVYAKNRRDIDKDFTSFSGNHAILNIPNNGKDIWLECTSQTAPFGFLGDFTDDRNVLVVTPEGGQIKRTASYKNEQNLQSINAAIVIDETGTVKAKLKIVSQGIQYDNKYPIESLNKKEQNTYYKSSVWNYNNNLSIDRVVLNNDQDKVVFTEELSVVITDFCAQSADELLFKVNVFNRNNNTPKRYRNRKHPLKIERGFKDVDAYEIEIPSNYVVSESLLVEKKIENKFGNYQVSIKRIDNNHLSYKRVLLIKEGVYSKEDYKLYRSFRRKVAKNDNIRIALKKK